MDQVGVDSIVFFPQGSYGATEGNNTGGIRFHQGIVTHVWKVRYSFFMKSMDIFLYLWKRNIFVVVRAIFV